jgi:capsular polysaccharide transport system permease protein
MAQIQQPAAVQDIVARGAMMNGRVIVALIFREAALKFGDGPFSYVWTLVEPGVFVGIMLFMRIYIKNYMPAFGDSSILFLLTGLVVYRMTRSIINKSGRAILGNRTLFSLGQVKPPDVVIARTVMEYTVWLLVLAMFFFGAGRVMNQKVITDFQGFVLSLVAIFYFCLSLSMFNATFGALLPVWRSIWKIISIPTLVMSGAIYVPSQMPEEVIDIIKWSPFLHCIEGMRQSTFLDYISIYDPVYLYTFSTTALLVSLMIERMFRKDIIRSKGDDDEEDEML